MNCITRSTESALDFTTYEVVKHVSNSTFNKFVVTYDAISCEEKCQCLLFESRGILCRHSLSALSFERVDKVAPRYILERWSKNVKRRRTHIKSSHDEPLLESRSKTFDDWSFRSHNICEFVSESEKLTTILHQYKGKSKEKYLLSHEDAFWDDINDLQNLSRVRTIGHAKNRLKSNTGKQIANASKKKKKKVLSELNLLVGGFVIQSNSSLYYGQIINYQFSDLRK
ncbi:hypothetical protein Ahy_A07g034399 [Arachis hypogaea]|uniref:Protein FAR1-RELATED SEQUENCE n=1 Tax=Arachis hypogaea TaxID=3818 RepID=A0A445CBU4_ARAHY|nr:hypothetical protein Ahy_A07g034399 [Arachis hypogaea]